jgi:predicted transcriptional regulator
LGELEDAVMTRVWEWNRPVTVREVLEDLRQERAIAYTTVMTVLDNLHSKGWVRRERAGRAYRYEAVSTRAAYSASLMNDAWAASDNAAAALVAFFGMMSAEQTEALRDALRVSDVAGVRVSAPDGPDGAPEDARGAAEVSAPQDRGEEAGR